MTNVTLNTTERNVLQVAVDHLIEHLSETILWAGGGDNDWENVGDNTQRLIHAAMLKERLAQNQT